MAAIQGLRGTGQFGTDFRPTNYRELFTLLEPNGTAPLQALLAMTSSESTDDPKYNHFRDELPTRTIVVNGALNNSATTLTFDNDTADEAFMTGTPFCMLPVTSLNGLKISDGNVGSTYTKLINKWSEKSGIDIVNQIKKWNKEDHKGKSNNAPTPYQFKK